MSPRTLPLATAQGAFIGHPVTDALRENWRELNSRKIQREVRLLVNLHVEPARESKELAEHVEWGGLYHPLLPSVNKANCA